MQARREWLVAAWQITVIHPTVENIRFLRTKAQIFAKPATSFVFSSTKSFKSETRKAQNLTFPTIDLFKLITCHGPYQKCRDLLTRSLLWIRSWRIVSRLIPSHSAVTALLTVTTRNRVINRAYKSRIIAQSNTRDINNARVWENTTWCPFFKFFYNNTTYLWAIASAMKLCCARYSMFDSWCAEDKCQALCENLADIWVSLGVKFWFCNSFDVNLHFLSVLNITRKTTRILYSFTYLKFPNGSLIWFIGYFVHINYLLVSQTHRSHYNRRTILGIIHRLRDNLSRCYGLKKHGVTAPFLADLINRTLLDAMQKRSSEQHWLISGDIYSNFSNVVFFLKLSFPGTKQR